MRQAKIATDQPTLLRQPRPLRVHNSWSQNVLELITRGWAVPHLVRTLRPRDDRRSG